MSQQNYPSTAYILSIIAGIFVLLGGLLLAALGAAITFFAFGIGAVLGVFGIICGILIIVGAVNLRSHPQAHATWGAVILVFSIISWVGAIGGFFIGFLLGLIGGILAIAWQPTQVQTAPAYAAPFPPATAPTQANRFCPNCGAPIDANATYCPHCGKQLM